MNQDSKQPLVLPGTGEVARQHGLAEGQLQQILRRLPHLTPPIVSGRRVWRDEDVEALDTYLAARQAEGAA